MKCGDKEWQHCQVEKMGCTGCYYNEIEPYEYIRTESGNIFIVDSEKKVLQGLKFLNVQYGDITKHSKNIKDIVSYKDLIVYRVNGKQHKGFVTKYHNELGINFYSLDQIEISKIVTREKLLQNVFEVEWGIKNESI